MSEVLPYVVVALVSGLVGLWIGAFLMAWRHQGEDRERQRQRQRDASINQARWP